MPSSSFFPCSQWAAGFTRLLLGSVQAHYKPRSTLHSHHRTKVRREASWICLVAASRAFPARVGDSSIKRRRPRPICSSAFSHSPSGPLSGPRDKCTDVANDGAWPRLSAPHDYNVVSTRHVHSFTPDDRSIKSDAQEILSRRHIKKRVPSIRIGDAGADPACA
jgi:hypothetical protein